MFFHFPAYLYQNLYGLAILCISMRSKIFHKGKRSMWIHISGSQIEYVTSWAPAWFPGGVGDVLGRDGALGRGGCSGSGGIPPNDGIGSDIGWLRRPGGDAPVHLHFHHVCWYCAVTLCHRRLWSVQFGYRVTVCHSIGAFTKLCPGLWRTRIFLSWTLASGFLIRYYFSFIAACENTPYAKLPVFKARHMADCSSYTRPPSLATIAVMLTTFKKIVAALTVQVVYYLDHICCRSLYYGAYSVCHLLVGMLMMQFVRGNGRSNNVTIFGFLEYVDKCRGWPRSFHNISRQESVI
jgi:hypothetical protein